VSQAADRRLRQGSPRPDQDSYLDTLGKLGEEIAEHRQPIGSLEREVRREIPASQMNVRPSLRERLGDPGQGLGTVDQDINRVAAPDDRPFSPPPGRRIKRALPTNPP